jgi:gamma-glutamyltranspeptidase/glutathione hydrolase
MTVSTTVRPPVRAARGMVASSHHDVSAAGASVLADGGTAADAALAMAAMSFVALPGQCGVGGDAFAVWYDASTGRYSSVQGSGVGPDGADAAFYRERGLDAIPLDGALSVAVPGAVAAMDTLHRALATRPLSQLWAPAIEAARDGVAVSEKTHTDITTNADKLARDETAARVFLPGGKVPAVGETFRQGALAETLTTLAASPREFYAGAIARRCLGALTSLGAPLSGREWSSTDAVATDTVTGHYRGHVVHQTRLPTPGYMVLQQAAILDGVVSEQPWLSADAVHWFTQAARRAFADRWFHVGSDTDAWQDLLTAAAVGHARRRIATGVLGDVRAPVRAGDTTSFVAVDAAGNAVSFIHSLAFTFGAGVMVPGTGIMLNDRLGRGSYLYDDHPNALRPGRKPMHTLNAWIVADHTGRPAFVGSTPGGDGQVQWNMQLLSHLLDHGLDVQQAVEAPRFSVFPGSDADTIDADYELRVESRLDDGTVEGLRRRGHPVVVQGPWDGGGSAQIIAIDADRGLTGGSDPRFDGGAVGV